MADFQQDRIDRVDMPSWVREPSPGLQDSFMATVGTQLEWGFALPWLWRQLAAPWSAGPFLRKPRVGDPVAHACGYWLPLLDMLVLGLGWSRPDLGLQRWLEGETPLTDNSPHLQLIRDVWLADGQLDWLLSWLGSENGQGPEFMDALEQTIASFTGRMVSDEAMSLDERWLNDQVRSAEASKISNPLSGGADPLHLSVHVGGGLGKPAVENRLLLTDPAQRSAVLICDSMGGWYRALAARGEELPNLEQRSWRVDVFVPALGWLGTYRQSRETKLWFSGPHSVHVMGV